ncbi:uncharacterized protein LOC124957677 [Vespa velutina]|uniref:uncharacterized protein LOC124957677 n=1 Tax=Vespa velutina TaxID=202808 RepID=UPI001FB3031D|nr:uncharacterized protein LOC124957677 [Vespa velutina]
MSLQFRGLQEFHESLRDVLPPANRIAPPNKFNKYVDTIEKEAGTHIEITKKCEKVHRRIMLVDGGRRREGGMEVESSIKAIYIEPLEPIAGRNSVNEETSEGGRMSLRHDMRERSNDVTMKKEKKRKEGTVYPRISL